MSILDSSADNISQSSNLKSIADEDIKATREREIVQNLELKKKRLEIEINQLESDISTISSESFTREQLATVKSELEETCKSAFSARTNSLLVKIEQAKNERQMLEKRLASLKRTLESERQITKQFIEERSKQRNSPVPPFPEVVLPDINLLKEGSCMLHRKKVLEEETREAERQLSSRRQTIAEEESKLMKIIQDSKAATTEAESKIRMESLEIAQLEETRSSLKERLESAKQRQRELEAEKKTLQSKIEAAEIEHRAKLDEINRAFASSQMEFEEIRARKLSELRELQTKLKENEEINKSKRYERDQLLQTLQDKRSLSQPSPDALSPQMSEPLALQRKMMDYQMEIRDLQAQKQAILQKTQDLMRKMNSNEKKLERVKSKIEKKLSESERKLRNLNV